MSTFAWKSFWEDEDRPEKPRISGVTEVRSPQYSLLSQNLLEDIFESMGQFVDGLKLAGGAQSLLSKEHVREMTNMAHKHDVYVSTGDWSEHLLRRGPSAFKDYIEECKKLGFDTIELDAGSMEFPEESLLRYVRLIKNSGLRAKPQFSVKINQSDVPVNKDRAFGAYIVPKPRSSEFVEDVNLLIRRAERCLEAGADMIMIDAADICQQADSVRADMIAKIIGRLGIEKTMFEASNPRTSEWFVKQYGPKVNLFVDHSQVMDLECLRGRNLGKDHTSVLALTHRFKIELCKTAPRHADSAHRFQCFIGLIGTHLEKLTQNEIHHLRGTITVGSGQEEEWRGRFRSLFSLVGGRLGAYLWLETRKMPAVWFALKKSLQCKSETADVYDPYGRRKNLSNVLTKKTGRSGCSRSIANLRDVIHGSKRHMEEKPPICSPRSIGSSELLNPITHEVVLSNSTCELKISGPSFSDGNGTDSEIGCSTFLGTLKPGTPGPGGHLAASSFRNKGLGSPIRRSSSSLSRRRTSAFVGLGVKPRHSAGADFQGCTTLTCHKCGEQFLKLDAAEEHHLSKHAVTELVEGDSSRKIVEIICRTKPDHTSSAGGIERILKVHNMQKTIAQFEDHRELVKIKASKLLKKHPRCLADGNELLRFHGTTVECPLGMSGSSSLCTSEKCAACQILRHGFKAVKEVNNDIGIFTASTSSRAFESIQVSGGGDDHDSINPPLRKALIVCRVIAGRVHKPLENVQELVGQTGFDSLAGKVGVHSNIEELFLLSTKALLPCFVVICKS